MTDMSKDRSVYIGLSESEDEVIMILQNFGDS
jgi:hypothetical protein